MNIVLDVILLVVTVVFFAVSLGFANVCERI